MIIFIEVFSLKHVNVKYDLHINRMYTLQYHIYVRICMLYMHTLSAVLLPSYKIIF